MEMQQIALPALVALSIGGAIYTLAYPYVSGEAKANQRKAALQVRSSSGAASKVNEGAKRRKAVADSLKELEDRNKSTKITFEARMAQAGLGWSKTKFWIISAVMGLVAAMVTFVLSGNTMMVAGIAVICGLGMPRWFVGRQRKRRMDKFLKEFPTAVDIIVRGIKAGIPLGDCIRNIANEAAEPVRTEFRSIVEAQAMGLTVADACEKLIERVPLSEANFFVIVINIQSKAGGNLAEELATARGQDTPRVDHARTELARFAMGSG